MLRLARGSIVQSRLQLRASKNSLTRASRACLSSAQLEPCGAQIADLTDLTDQKAVPRSVTLRALDIPVTHLLSPRVEHLLADREDSVVQLIQQCLQLPEVCCWWELLPMCTHYTTPESTVPHTAPLLCRTLCFSSCDLGPCTLRLCRLCCQRRLLGMPGPRRLGTRLSQCLATMYALADLCAVHACPCILPSHMLQLRERAAERAPCLQLHHQKTRRATRETILNEHAYIRVHLHVKRSPAFHLVDWKVLALHGKSSFGHAS